MDELIWRDFYQMILCHFSHVVSKAFKPEYDKIRWRNNENEFDAWCNAQTGYPIVDAGMRELNETGYMHNRVRMIVASFLWKQLLIDWRWGKLILQKNFWTLTWRRITETGNGQRAVVVMRLRISGYSILSRKQKNLTRN